MGTGVATPPEALGVVQPKTRVDLSQIKGVFNIYVCSEEQINLLFSRSLDNKFTMTIQQIYDLALKMGLKADPRGEDGVKKYLAKIKKQYEALPASEKKYFDQTKLVDPYADSSIHLVDKPNAEVINSSII